MAADAKPRAGRALTANATVAFVLGAMITSVVHELAHAVAGLAVGLTPVVSPFSVSYIPEGTPSQELVTASAGPLFSLVLGLVLMIIGRRWGSGFVRLFWMWLAFMSVMNFVGYLVIAPLAPAGDTGRALALLGAPDLVVIAAMVIGIGGQFLLARRFATEVKRYAADRSEERRLALLSWAIGTPIVIVLTSIELLLLQVPPELAVPVAMYAFAVGVFAPMQFIFSKRASNARELLTLRLLPLPGLVVTVVVAVLLIGLAGVGGIRLGS